MEATVSAEENFRLGNYNGAIACALIDITKKLDIIANELADLADSQRRIADVQAPRPSPPYRRRPLDP